MKTDEPKIDERLAALMQSLEQQVSGRLAREVRLDDCERRVEETIRSLGVAHRRLQENPQASPETNRLLAKIKTTLDRVLNRLSPSRRSRKSRDMI